MSNLDFGIKCIIDPIPDACGVNIIETIVADQTFLDLKDTPSSYSGQAGLFPAVNGTETGLDFVAVGGGATTFLALTDTPGAYVADQNVVVNGAATALIFQPNSFINLSDTPGAYGATGQIPVINGTTDGLVFANLPANIAGLPDIRVGTTEATTSVKDALTTVPGFPIIKIRITEDTAEPSDINFAPASATTVDIWIDNGVTYTLNTPSTMSNTTLRFHGGTLAYTLAGAGSLLTLDAAETLELDSTNLINASAVTPCALVNEDVNKVLRFSTVTLPNQPLCFLSETAANVQAAIILDNVTIVGAGATCDQILISPGGVGTGLVTMTGVVVTGTFNPAVVTFGINGGSSLICNSLRAAGSDMVFEFGNSCEVTNFFTTQATFIFSPSNGQFSNCRFGGVHDFVTNTSSTLLFSNCLFTNNTLASIPIQGNSHQFSLCKFDRSVTWSANTCMIGASRFIDGLNIDTTASSGSSNDFSGCRCTTVATTPLNWTGVIIGGGGGANMFSGCTFLAPAAGATTTVHGDQNTFSGCSFQSFGGTAYAVICSANGQRTTLTGCNVGQGSGAGNGSITATGNGTIVVGCRFAGAIGGAPTVNANNTGVGW